MCIINIMQSISQTCKNIILIIIKLPEFMRIAMKIPARISMQNVILHKYGSSPMIKILLLNYYSNVEQMTEHEAISEGRAECWTRLSISARRRGGDRAES